MPCIWVPAKDINCTQVFVSQLQEIGQPMLGKNLAFENFQNFQNLEMNANFWSNIVIPVSRPIINHPNINHVLHLMQNC